MKKIKSRKWQSGKTGAVLVLSVCSMLLILNGIRKNAAQLQYQLQQYLLRSAQAMYVPSLVWKEDSVSSGPGEWIRQKALAWIPVVQYVEDHAEYGSSLEDEETIAKILESQANDENAVDENGKLIGQPDEPQQPVSSEVAADQSIDKLRDFEYLLSNFYTVDSSTMIGAEQLNVDDLLGRNMKIGREGNEPKILIFHTHSQETFVGKHIFQQCFCIYFFSIYRSQASKPDRVSEYGLSQIHRCKSGLAAYDQTIQCIP